MQSETINRRDLKKAHTRSKVIEAARELFDSRGYERTTMLGIANRMDMSTGAIFASFDSKDQIYSEIYGHAPVSADHGRALLIALTRIRSSPDHETAIKIASETVSDWAKAQ